MNTKLIEIWGKFKDLFKQGLTPKQLALSIVVSFLISVFPIFGISTIVLTCIAIPFKLNLPIMIGVSYLVEPLKVLFIIPFINLGATVLGKEHSLLTFKAIKTSFNNSFWHTLKELSFELLCGTIGWLLLAIPMGLLIYLVLKMIFTYFYKIKNKQLSRKE